MKTEIVSIRLPTDFTEQLKKLAVKYDMTISALLRITVLHETDRYLSTLCFIDDKKTDEIKKAVCDLLNVSQDMTVQIRRIGTNYNQIAHAMNKSVKDNSTNTVTNTSNSSGFKRTSTFAIKHQLQQTEHEKNTRQELEKAAADLISDSTLSDLIGTYTAAAKSMQDALADIYKAVM